MKHTIRFDKNGNDCREENAGKTAIFVVIV